MTGGDATSSADTAAAVDATVEAFGGIDVLATFVGVFDYYLGLGELTDEQLDAGFDEAFRVNVKSPLISVKAALSHLVAARGAVILTASSSSFGPGRGGVLYVGTKFAVRGLVVALAHELAPAVRVNAVAPGGTLGTDLRGLAALEQAGRSLGDVPGREADLRARTPLQVALTAEDHAASYVFLAGGGRAGDDRAAPAARRRGIHRLIRPAGRRLARPRPLHVSEAPTLMRHDEIRPARGGGSTWQR